MSCIKNICYYLYYNQFLVLSRKYIKMLNFIIQKKQVFKSINNFKNKKK
uniref:Uncharacterized protein n=1 Tax=viral metagenome TaxID=1070528 RepID=A0A6C0IZS9_9ZZZZ